MFLLLPLVAIPIVTAAIDLSTRCAESGTTTLDNSSQIRMRQNTSTPADKSPAPDPGPDARLTSAPPPDRPPAKVESLSAQIGALYFFGLSARSLLFHICT